MRVMDAVGVVALPTLELHVRPKIPQIHLLYLLEKASFVPAFTPDVAHLEKNTSLLELIAQWFVTSLERLLEEGLARDYRPVKEELSVARGRVSPLATAGLYYRGRLSVIAEFEEFDFDTRLNRVLREAARLVLSAPVLSAALRRRSSRATARMDGVGPLRSGDLDAVVDRRTAHYRAAIMLAKRLIEGAGLALLPGEGNVWTFLIRTPTPVEVGIRTTVQRGLKGAIPVVKKAVGLQGSAMTLNPDLVFGQDACVGDVKYKLAQDEWQRSDLYEIVAFAAGLKTEHAAILTFREPQQQPLPAVQVGEIRVRQLSWLATDALTPAAAASGLVSEVLAWLQDQGLALIFDFGEL